MVNSEIALSILFDCMKPELSDLQCFVVILCNLNVC